MDTFISNILRMTLIQTVLYTKEQIIAVTWVSLDKSSITLSTVWQTEQLTATVSPNNATNKNVNWSSSNTSIATVSNTWLVTCVTPWSATITVTTVDGWFTDTCSVAQWWWTPWANTYMYRPLLSNANDGSWNNRNGTVNGTVTWNSWAVFAWSWQISSPLNSMPTNFTISCWVNKAQNSTSEQVLFAKWWSSTERWRFAMLYDGSGNLKVRNTPSERGSSWVTVWNYGYNTLHNVIYVKDGLTIKVYVNWSLATTVWYYQWYDDTRYYLGIWWWSSTQRNFYWTIKDFIVENKARTTQEVQDYYNQTK